MWDGMTLIPGRDCGGCTVCCTVLPADDATLKNTAVLDPAETVPGDVARIVESSTISGRIAVSGFSYDLATGLVTRVVGPTSRG